MAERTGNGGHGLVKGATVFGLAVPMIVIVPLVMLMSLSTILVAWSRPSTARRAAWRTRPVRRVGLVGEERSRMMTPMVTVRRIVTAIRITIVRRSSITR